MFSFLGVCPGAAVLLVSGTLQSLDLSNLQSVKVLSLHVDTAQLATKHITRNILHFLWL